MRLALAGLLLSLAPLAMAAAAAKLQAVSVQSGSGAVTVQLTLSAAVRQRSFTLDNPSRLVIDLSATRAAANLRLPAVVAPLKKLRSAAQPDGGLRVVLELEPGTPTVVTQLAAGGSYGIQVLAGNVPQPSAVAANPPTLPAPVAAPVAIRPAHAPGSADRDIVVAIDAGHGGTDPGASGRGGTREKDVTLAIARALAARIERQPGMRAILTRDRDVFVPLRERTQRARNAGVHLFVSIHADAVRDRDVDGASVYVLSDRGASSEAARMLADRENAADLHGVSLADKNANLASVLLDLSQSASLGTSAEAAGQVLTALDQVGVVRKRQVQHAAFVVLKSPAVPSMLIETAYISNPAEERKLRDPGYQRRLADAIYDGIQGYFHDHPPDGTLFARQRRDGGGAGATLARSGP